MFLRDMIYHPMSVSAANAGIISVLFTSFGKKQEQDTLDDAGDHEPTISVDLF